MTNVLNRRTCLSILGAPAFAASKLKTRERIRHAMQEVMGPMPGTPRGLVRLEMLSDQPAGGDGAIRRKVRFESEPGCWVPAHLFLPSPAARGNQRVAAVLCLHQTNRAIGKDEPAGLAGNPHLACAAELAARGFVTLAPDYCRFGEYTIDPYAMGYQSATMKGIWDHSRAVDLLAAMPEVNPRAIGAIGHSLGGHNSLFLAAFDERVRAVVTSCGFTSFAKYYNGDLKGWSHAGYMPRIASAYGASAARMPFDFSDVLRAILPNRVFVYAPLEDSNFDPSGVRDAIAGSGARVNQVVLRQPHGTHAFPSGFRQEAYRFLARALR